MSCRVVHVYLWTLYCIVGLFILSMQSELCIYKSARPLLCALLLPQHRLFFFLLLLVSSNCLPPPFTHFFILFNSLCSCCCCCCTPLLSSSTVRQWTSICKSSSTEDYYYYSCCYATIKMKRLRQQRPLSGNPVTATAVHTHYSANTAHNWQLNCSVQQQLFFFFK